MDAHLNVCLNAGIAIGGTNAEVMPGSWEYQIGPNDLLENADDMWMSRYFLQKVTEDYEVIVSFDPKPIKHGDWNGAGCHINFSTEEMRQDGGYSKIIEAVEKLGARHAEHISMYGDGNEFRLTGRHETASITDFSWGVANRGCSIRIPFDVHKHQKGYLEDRRPASNVDPYIGNTAIAATCLLEDKTDFEALKAHVDEWNQVRKHEHA